MSGTCFGRTPQGSGYNPATTNRVVLIASQIKKPIQATLQSNAMHKTKVADLPSRPRFRARTGTDPSFVGPSFILGSQEIPSEPRVRRGSTAQPGIRQID